MGCNKLIKVSLKISILNKIQILCFQCPMVMMSLLILENYSNVTPTLTR